MNRFTYISILAATLLFTACQEAGEDQVVLPGTTVTLGGSGDSTIESIVWKQVAGPSVELSDKTAINPTFIAPEGDARLDLEFETEIVKKPNEDSNLSNEDIVDLVDSYFGIENIFADSVKITVKNNDKILNTGIDTVESNEKRVYIRDNSANTVTDKVNNLVWSDTVLVSKKYDSTDYGNETVNNYLNDNAQSYCEFLTLDDRVWRLPNFRELQTLVDYSKRDKTIDSAFKEVGAGDYVSKISDYLASIVLFGTKKTPRSIDFTTASEKSVAVDKETYVRCVSGDTLEAYNFVREENATVLLDPTNNLMWQDSVQRITNYDEGVEYCADSNESGYTNWRLATINELVTTIDYHEDPDSATNREFLTWAYTNYISATSDVLDDSKVWTINSEGLNQIKSVSKNEDGIVRCVRNNEI